MSPCDATWIFASAQSTSSPFIQIFSVACIALALLCSRRIVGLIRDDVHRPGARQPAQLRGADAHDVLVRARARPDERVLVELALHEDGVDLRQRERCDGAGREAGRVLHFLRLRDPRRLVRRRRLRPSRVAAPITRNERDDGALVADEDERLHDLIRARNRPRRPHPARSTCRRGTRGCALRLRLRGGRRTPARRAPARPLPRAQPSFRSVDEGNEPVAACVCSTPHTLGSGAARKRSSTRAFSAQSDGEGGGADERPRGERKRDAGEEEDPARVDGMADDRERPGLDELAARLPGAGTA